MTQEPLFADDIRARQLAIEADISAAGGLQSVGMDLQLADDPISAGRALSNKVQRSGRHELKDSELWQIKALARQRVGRSVVHEWESSALDYEGGKWLTTEDIKARRRKRKAALLAELIALEQEES